MSLTTIITDKTNASESSLPVLQGCSQALIAFGALGRLKEKLSAVRLSEPVLTTLDQADQFLGFLNDSTVLLLQFRLPGCRLADLIRELADLGIKSVLGYGLASSLTTQIPPGQIVLAESAVDATQKLAFPYHRLFHDVRACAARQCLSIRRARILSADPVSPDYLQTITHRRELQAEVVHRDTRSFYTACQKHALFAAFLCVITDILEKDLDTHQINQTTLDLHHLLIDTLTTFHPQQPNYG